MMTMMNLNVKGALVVAALAVMLLAGEATADHRHGGNDKPQPVRVADSGGRTYHYRVGYRDGVSKYNWLGFRRGVDNSSGYTGARTSINRPHRSSWNAKLKAQRKWDEKQYAKMQADGGAACGLSNAPAYCYRLNKPYPQVIQVVRY